MYIPMEYHLIFILIQFSLTILIVFMMFIEPTVEKVTGAYLFIGVNFIFCILAGLSFFSVDAHGFTADGVLVHNLILDMRWLSYIYLLFGFFNVMFIVYGAYLYMNKPWDDLYGKKEYSIYQNRF